MYFLTKRNPILEPVYIGDLEVKPSPIVKWLGIYFDPKLTFKIYIEKKLALA